MTRKDFVKMCSLLGIGLPFQSTLASCNGESGSSNFNGKVIIVGAGAGGMTAGYLLRQLGIEFEILEASSTYGGRMKTDQSFVDFPIPLGAEWLHVDREVFSEIVNDPARQINTITTPYDFDQDYALFEGQRISMRDVGFSIDQKFVNATWLTFFEEYVIPSVIDKIRFETIVESVDYQGDQIVVVSGNQEFTADRLVISVPVRILQRGDISFNPALPNNKVEALSDVRIWDGFKAFIEFSEKFYPTAIAYEIMPESAGEKLYYDAAYGQNSNRNVLGLFTVGTGTLPYRTLSDMDLINYILNELDAVFDGQASEHYIQHTSQDWNEEPFINGAYIISQEDWTVVRTLGESINDRIYFAGDGYTTGEDWSSVHTAARSAIRAIREMTAT